MTVSDEPAGAGTAVAARLPDFFIIGHHKSGTTALYEMLRRHPQIFMPTLKEPRFFDTDLHALTNTHSTGWLPGTLEEYLALFREARPGQRLGEASPSYLRSATAASAIAAAQPSARCIAILREPASFVRSMHMQLVQEHVEAEKDLREAVAKEEIERAGRRVLRYSDHVHYVEQLRRFHAVFPPEQVLVLIYDDFRDDNEGTVKRVLRFLEVDDSVPIEVFDANPSVSVRSLRLDAAVRAMYAGSGPLARAVKRTAGALIPARARHGAVRRLRRGVIYGKPQPVDEDLMIDLRRRYKAQVYELSDYLGRDLAALWGYDALD
jgi:hypothetical protein